MDLDAYVAEHSATWVRFAALAKKRRLTGAEVDELVDTYQQVSTHLSVIRSQAPDPSLVGNLSAVLLRARGRIAGRRVHTWQAFTRFWVRQFPAALYRLRWWWLSTALANVVVAGLMIWWFLENPRFESSILSPQEIDQLVNEDVEGYYSEYAASEFSTLVWVNNSWVAAQALAMGVLGLPVVYVLFLNVLNLALIASLMIRHDRGALFWGLILPHGLLELTAIFVAAGVGFRLFWAWVVPGARTRIQALAQEGRTAGAVALGLIAVLALSGVIEGFVTPSELPTWARVGIGVLAELAFLTYVFGLGRRAYYAGETGDLAADRREAFIPAVD